MSCMHGKGESLIEKKRRGNRYIGMENGGLESRVTFSFWRKDDNIRFRADLAARDAKKKKGGKTALKLRTHLTALREKEYRDH